MANTAKLNGWHKDLTTGRLSVYVAGTEVGRFTSTTITDLVGRTISTGGGGAASSALLQGVGSTSAPEVDTAGNKNFMGYWVKSSAASGDTRGMYLRLYISGAGSGEAGRFYTTIDAANAATGGTVNGAHISCSVTGSGTVSGAANALRTTFDVATNLTPGGTLASIQCDTNLASGVTLPSSHAWIRFTNSGSVGFTRLLSVPTVASGGVLAAHVTDAVTHSIRIRDEAGTLYYIMCTTTTSNRTGGA